MSTESNFKNWCLYLVWFFILFLKQFIFIVLTYERLKNPNWLFTTESLRTTPLEPTFRSS